MGFVLLLMLFYAPLIAGTIIAFVKKKYAIGIILSAIMTVIIVYLGILWLTSPM